LAVVEEAVEVEGKGAGDPQTTAGEDESDQPAGWAGPAVQVGGCLDLGHDVLGEAAVDLFGDRGDVAEVEGGGAGQRVVPPVLADVLEEQVEPADPGLLHAVSAGLGGDVGEIAFQQRPVDVGESVDSGQGEELTKAGERVHPAPGCADAQPGGQPQPCPSFGQLAQPGLGDAVKPQPGARAGPACRDGDAGQLVQPPHIPWVLDLPAGPVTQRLQRVTSVEQEQGRLANPGAGALPPLLFRQVQQRGDAHRLDVPDSRDQARSGGAGAGIVSALQRVLNLQPQRRGEVMEIDAGGADKLAAGDEAVGPGPAMPLPPIVVARAEDLRRIRDPEAAKRQPALRRHGAGRGQVRRVPGGQVRLTGPVPPIAVLGTQSISGAAPVTATVHRAGSQRPAAPDRWARISEEVLHRRAATLAEPDGMWSQPYGRPWTYAAVYDLVLRLRQQTGIAFSPHWCRHTYATWLQGRGVASGALFSGRREDGAVRGAGLRAAV